MTRFARAKGSKASNEKRPEEATSWLEMRRSMLTKPTQDIPENYRRDFIQKKEVNTAQKPEWASLGEESLLRPAYVFSPKTIQKPEWASLEGESLLRPSYVFSNRTVEQEPKGINKKFNSGVGEQQSSNFIKKREFSKVSIEPAESSKNEKKINNVNPDDVSSKIKKKKSGDVDTVSNNKKKLGIVDPDDISNKIKKKKSGDVDSSCVNNVSPDVSSKIKKKKSGDVDTQSNSKNESVDVNSDDVGSKTKKKKKKSGDVDSSCVNNVNPDDVSSKVKKKKSGEVDTVSNSKNELVDVNPDDVGNKIKKKKKKSGDVGSSCVNNVNADDVSNKIMKKKKKSRDIDSSCVNNVNPDVSCKIEKKKSGEVDTVPNSKNELVDVNPDDVGNKTKKKKKKSGDLDSSCVNNVNPDDVSSKIKKKKKKSDDTDSSCVNNVNPDDVGNKTKKKKKKLGDVDSSCGEQPVKKKKNSDTESVKNKKKDKEINSLDSNHKMNKKKRKLDDNDTESITKKKKSKPAGDTETNNAKNNEQSGSKKKFGSKEPYFKNKPQFESKPYNKSRHEDKRNPEVIDEIIVNGEKVSIVKFQGFPVTQEDAERLKKLRTQMIKEGIPKNRIEGAIKLERRRAEKALSRLKKAVCFHCRGSGHVLSNCPMLTDGPDTSTGICYKCGSTEHSALECKVVKGTNFQFAECFICKEQGHIARQCPDNPRGLYPQGGACRECGDVTHLWKDCPKVLSEKTEETITVGIRNDRNLECLDEEIEKREKEGAKKPVKKNIKIKF